MSTSQQPLFAPIVKQQHRRRIDVCSICLSLAGIVIACRLNGQRLVGFAAGIRRVHPGIEKVHSGRTDKAGDKYIFRIVIRSGGEPTCSIIPARSTTILSANCHLLPLAVRERFWLRSNNLSRRRIAAAHGPIDVLVNNAASDNRLLLADYSAEQWDASININLRPHFFTAQAVADEMRQSGGGSIINFSSISYMMGNAGYPAYVATKAGITGLTRGLARELGPHNIRVNALMPGWVLTDRQRELWVTDEALAAHLARQCLPEALQPEDIVAPTLFLASSASRMMTGQALVVDGGVVTTG